MKRKVLLLGASGLVGTSINESLTKKYVIVSPPRNVVDLTDDYSIKNFFKNAKYDVIIYAAGITNQDAAEKDKKLTKRINSDAVSLIAKRAMEINSQFIYFSTDAVFSGKKIEQKSEKSTVSPVNYYGTTKAKGEENVLAYPSIGTVIRLNSVYTHFFESKLDFARGIVKSLKKDGHATGIVDQYFNPTYAYYIGDVVDVIIQEKIFGILHFGAKDCISNFEFVQLVSRRFGHNTNSIKPIKFKDFIKTKEAKRGQYCCLDTTYSEKVLGKKFYHSNQENIDHFFNFYKN